MASKPGILTEWPGSRLGNFKYAMLAPFVIHSTYSYLVKDESERDLSNFLIFPFLLSRALHNQIWISLSRYRTAKGSNRITDKNIEFEQVDREKTWDDQIITMGIGFYLLSQYREGVQHLPLWRIDGVIWTILLHLGPVEFVYYWLHRALHHHVLYSRYHSHHHSSIATEPISSVVHPYFELLLYKLTFWIALAPTVAMGNISVASVYGYITFVDFMNNMGHCNFEHVPKWLFNIFPPLKYIMYTPTYHTLHHTQFRTNYSLFMPLYDYIYGTMDKSSDSLYEASLVRKEESPDVVYLTHLTTAESIYHLRIGFAHFASQPQKSKWYLRLLFPLTLLLKVITWIYGRTFIVERNIFKHLKLQTWVVAKYSAQFHKKNQKESINNIIENAILEAEEKGVKVLSFGLLNQEEGLNGNGELFIKKHPQLKVKLVDGNSLAVAIVLNSIPKGTTQVVVRGILSKVAYSIALILCKRGVQVFTIREDDFKKLKEKLGSEVEHNLILSEHNTPKTWLVGHGLSEDEQLKASKGTIFIPFSQFPPKKKRKDCSYYQTPAMLAPKDLENVDSCENWLPRKVLSAWRIAGIVHAIEGWNVHEYGNFMFDTEKIWKASIDHGFCPLIESKADVI